MIFFLSQQQPLPPPPPPPPPPQGWVLSMVMGDCRGCETGSEVCSHVAGKHSGAARGGEYTRETRQPHLHPDG